MNKKKLSVVMAGAMLSATVVPTMAAVTDVSSADLGLLIRRVRETLLSKKFSNVSRNANVNGVDLRNKSVYFVKIDGKECKAITDALESNDDSKLQIALQENIGTLKSGQRVEIWSRGYVEEDNKVYATTLKEKYTKDDMNNTLAEQIYNSVKVNNNILANNLKDVQSKDEQSKDVQSSSEKNSQQPNEINKEEIKKDTSKEEIARKENVVSISNAIDVDLGKSITINLAKDSGLTKPIVIEPGSKILDFTKYIDENGNSNKITSTTPKDAKDFFGFPEVEKDNLEYTEDLQDELIESIKIVGNSSNVFKTSELYNGVMLTTDGHELLSKIKDVVSEQKDNPSTKAKYSFATLTGLNIGSGSYNLPQSNDGSYGFTISITDKFGKNEDYTIKGENKKDTQILLNWLYNHNAKVDILAGENRYETAVEVAKEYAGMNNPFEDGKGTIVMVNGNSLVDGLSASPLAAQKNAPMLLVEKDRIPKATAEYIRKLSGEATVGDLKGITINIVGGTSVVSKDVEKELKYYGFTVKRFGGKDREDTSMKVAKEINNSKSAFVVGAEGEADAMSISSVASSKTLTNTGITPIIVSNKKGLSEDTLESLSNKSVTVVGGEAVVSKEEFNNIKEAVGKNNSVDRIFGENRQETNAKVINTYYKGNFGKGNDVLVAKDGQRNKMELVDALTVSNLAAQKNAPIVLATNKLDKSQINALELNARAANALYQVGHGVSLDVVKTLANLLGLSN